MLVQATPEAHAGTWPERPVRLVVPFAAGTQIDNAARLVGARLGDALGQSVVVENRPGASGNIGAEMVARSPADGYTLLVTGSVITLLPTTLGPQAVDPVTAFVPVAKLARVPLVIVVHPSLKVGTLAELIALARTRTRQDRLRHVRRGHRGAPVRGDARAACRRRHGARPLCQHWPGAQRCPGG